MDRVLSALKKTIALCREKLADKRLFLPLAGFLLLALALALFARPAPKREELAGLLTNKRYLDNLIFPPMQLPEWFYPYERPVDFRYSDKELERLLPAASPELIAELEQKRKAKINAILKK